MIGRNKIKDYKIMEKMEMKDASKHVKSAEVEATMKDIIIVENWNQDVKDRI